MKDTKLQKPHLANPLAKPKPPSSEPCSVLIVEDSLPVAMGLRLLFKSLGIQVIEADSAETGLAQWMTHQPDLVITDIGFPKASGIELAKWIRSKQHTASPYLLVALSAHMNASIEKDCLAAGMQASYTKPLCPKQAKALVEQCRLLIEQAKQNTSEKSQNQPQEEKA